MTDPDQLLSEFIDAWNAGRRPRALEYLRRVPEGAARDELADQIGTWLEVAPVPDYDDATRAEIRAEPAVQSILSAADGGAWPALLPALRARAGLSLGDLASRVAERFGLGSGSEERTADYLGRMERGELDPARVSRRLLDGLGSLLGVPGPSLADAGAAGWRPQAAGATLLRADLDMALGEQANWTVREVEALSLAALTPAPERMDELDRLFTGGREA